MQDLVVALDNADSRMLYAHFFPQEGTAPIFVAPEWVLRNYGRSPSFTLTAGSDFCHSERPTRGACLPATMPQAGPLHANKVTLPTRSPLLRRIARRCKDLVAMPDSAKTQIETMIALNHNLSTMPTRHSPAVCASVRRPRRSSIRMATTGSGKR
jgi:hypothetical protein